jgi:hypothetical protein
MLGHEQLRRIRRFVPATGEDSGFAAAHRHYHLFLARLPSAPLILPVLWKWHALADIRLRPVLVIRRESPGGTKHTTTFVVKVFQRSLSLIN